MDEPIYWCSSCDKIFELSEVGEDEEDRVTCPNCGDYLITQEDDPPVPPVL